MRAKTVEVASSHVEETPTCYETPLLWGIDAAVRAGKSRLSPIFAQEGMPLTVD
jgi:hypothetical protein